MHRMQWNMHRMTKNIVSKVKPQTELVPIVISVRVRASRAMVVGRRVVLVKIKQNNCRNGK